MWVPYYMTVWYFNDTSPRDPFLLALRRWLDPQWHSQQTDMVKKFGWLAMISFAREKCIQK